VSVYVNFALKSFQKQMAYRFEYFVGVFNGFLFIFIFTSLWKAVFRQAEEESRAGFTPETIVAYAVIAMILKISFTQDDMMTAQKIRTGAMAMDLIKPIRYLYMSFSECVGQSVFHWFSRSLPLLVFSVFLFDVALPADPARYSYLLVSGAFGYLILFEINFLIGLLAFWFIENFAFQLMKFSLITLFSGAILPVDFFPLSLQGFISWIPFKYIYYVPTAIFTGHMTGPEAIDSIFRQFVWIVVLYLFAEWTWKRATAKLVIQGG
jgi:ABC-2 type transport system permease protein